MQEKSALGEYEDKTFNLRIKLHTKQA